MPTVCCWPLSKSPIPTFDGVSFGREDAAIEGGRVLSNCRFSKSPIPTLPCWPRSKSPIPTLGREDVGFFAIGFNGGGAGFLLAFFVAIISFSHDIE
jgi:hypothetical protein